VGESHSLPCPLLCPVREGERAREISAKEYRKDRYKSHLFYFHSKKSEQKKITVCKMYPHTSTHFQLILYTVLYQLQRRRFVIFSSKFIILYGSSHDLD
jgi:hypothetical protein